MVHRDVKISNIVTVDGLVKVVDFGLAVDIGTVHSKRGGTKGKRPCDFVNGAGAYEYYSPPPEIGDRIRVEPALDLFASAIVTLELVIKAPIVNLSELQSCLLLLHRIPDGYEVRRLADLMESVLLNQTNINNLIDTLTNVLE